MSFDWVRQLLVRLALLLTETDTTLAEFWGSTTLLFLGAWLVAPFSPDTFDAIMVYRLMDSLLPEWIWGAAAIAVGGYQTTANLRRSTRDRRVAAFIASLFFGFMASLAFVSLPASLLTPVLGTASFLEGLIYLRLSLLDGKLNAAAG